MDGSNIIYLNYHIDPNRRPHMLQRFQSAVAPLGYRVVHALRDVDYPAVQVLVNKTRELTDEDVRRLPNLRGIVVWGTEKWMLSFEETAYPLEVKVLDVDRGTDVAEHAVALLLAGLKGLHRRPLQTFRPSPRQVYHWLFPRVATESVGAHNWTGARTGTLYGKKVGIVGYGLIGRQIHRRLEGFSCRVYYHHSGRFSDRVERQLGMSYLSLEEMFAACDAVFVQLPLTPATENLIRRDTLGRARDGLALINCGRAGVIHEEDLYQALRRGRIAFYGADVFWREPAAPWNRFCRLSNVLITPHLAESVPGAPDCLEKVIEQLRTFSGSQQWTRVE